MAKERKIPNHGIINKIRKAIDPLWEAAYLVGRSWGVKKDGNNPFFGSHILLGDAEHVVVVIENRTTKNVSVVEYQRSGTVTPLGNKIREVIVREGFALSDLNN